MNRGEEGRERKGDRVGVERERHGGEKGEKRRGEERGR